MCLCPVVNSLSVNEIKTFGSHIACLGCHLVHSYHNHNDIPWRRSIHKMNRQAIVFTNVFNMSLITIMYSGKIRRIESLSKSFAICQIKTIQIITFGWSNHSPNFFWRVNSPNILPAKLSYYTVHEKTCFNCESNEDILSQYLFTMQPILYIRKLENHISLFYRYNCSPI